VEFRILGPLEVVESGRLLPLGTLKEQALLAVLLLHANEVVSRERLIDELWGETPPATAGKAVQVYVSQLRKALAGNKSAIATRAGGYVFQVSLDQLDAARFQLLVGQAREQQAAGEIEEAAGRFREGLSLWRGTVLAGLVFESHAQTEVDRLEQLRLAALIDLLDCELALGRAEQVVGELEALVKQHPLRERLTEQLMLALYRSGRQADALRVYREARETLVSELGIEPSTALRELEAAILRQDTDLAPAVSEPALLPAPIADPPAREMRKTVTILFSDVVSSTELGEEADPEAVRRVLSRWYEEMRAVIARHGGTVEKFAGDEVMAVFGVPVVHEDDALRAVRAAAEMRAQLAALNEELEARRGVRLEARIGINTGEVVAGDPASGQTFVTGSAVNLGRRLEQAAGPGEILIGERTYPLVKDAVTARALESFTVKGRRQPVAPFRLDDVEPAAIGLARRLDAPMVGRKRELTLLYNAFERCVSDRSCHLLTLLGAGGIGKSRLIAEFVGLLDGGVAVLRGRCLPYGEGITYWPLAEVVRQAAGLRGDEAPGEAIAKIAGLLEGEDAALISERVAQLVGLSEATPGAEDAHWAARKLFEALAGDRPLVLVFEDMERAEAAFLDLVEHVTDLARDCPILTVCVARPDLLDARPAWGGGKLNAVSVLLEPLDDDDSNRLVGGLIDGDLDPAVTSRIVEAADGNPLFAEEYVAMLVDEGLIERRDSRWRAATALSALPIPHTIQGLLASRIDQLPAEDRAVLERGAVEGRIFHSAAVVALSDDAMRDQVERSLTRLVRQELIRPERQQFSGEDGFRFRHLLIRDAAYDAIPKELRADLHERFAAWLERRSTDYDEIIGYHLEQAFRCRTELGPLDDHARGLGARAAGQLAAAGRRAFARGDMRAAANLLERAVGLYPEGAGERLQLLPTLGKALRETGELGRAHGLLTDAVAHADAAGDRRVASLARIERASLRDYIDSSASLDELRLVAEQTIGVFEELDDDEGLAEACSLLAEVHWTRGQFAAMEEVLERALVHAERAGDERERAFLLGALARAAFLGPAPVEAALRRCDEIIAQAGADSVLGTSVLPPAGVLHALRGEFERARSLYRSARANYEEFGMRAALAALPLYSGPIELLAGAPQAAEQELRRGYEVLEEMGDLARLSTVAAFLAEALYAQGRYDEAERLTAVSADAATPDDVVSQAAWRGTRSKTLARKGELVQAERLGREAVALAEQTDGLNLHGDALLDLAEVLRTANRPGEAVAAAEQALSLYERKGNLVSAAKARAALEES
jgi:DNA-binding SARP family transcriptional activator